MSTKKYVVQIQTSVTVEGVPTPEAALEVAIGWAKESLANSNAVGKVYRSYQDGLSRALLIQDLH